MTQPTIRDTPHPYYGAEAFGDEYINECETLDELIEWAAGCDADLNFVYRWDWHVPTEESIADAVEDGEEPPRETLTLFVVLQRKSRFLNITAPVTAADEDKVREFLTSDRILGALRRTWAPLLEVRPSDENINRLAQTFYEASGITLPRMTDKPMIVRGLNAVFDRMESGMSA